MHLGGLELERQKFVAERDAASAQSSQRQYELQTERLKAVVDSLLTLKQLGADVRLEVVADRLIAAMPTLEAADVENVPMYRGGDDP